MNLEEYRTEGKKVVDYICEFRRTQRDQRVVPGPEIVANGLQAVMSDRVPIHGEDFETIMHEYKAHIVPRLVGWGHPKFAAYYAGGNAYASILGDMLCTGTNQTGFSWRASPAITEHEQLTLNMFAKVLNLPKFFLYDYENPETGGGALHASASDCVYLALLAARHRAVKLIKGNIKASATIHESLFLPGMVAYTSEEAHSCVEKAAKIAMIRLRILPTDERGALRGDVLRKAIEHDVNVEGFTPIFVTATVGTTGTCAFDDLDEVGNVCKKYPTIWLHVDGTYAGNSFILPEMEPFKRGLEHADSFNVNPNKLLLTSFDCSCFWVKHIKQLKESMSVNPTYLEKDGDEGEDLRHFGIPLSRRFRSLKLWCVLRNYGQIGLQKFLRTIITLAKHLESLLKTDERFAIVNEVHLGLVCFKLRIPGESKDVHDRVNIEYLQRINRSGEIHMVPTRYHGSIVIRYCVATDEISMEDMEDSFRSLQKFASTTLSDYSKGQLDFQRKDQCDFHPRFSYARTVPHGQFHNEVEVPHLRDGAEEICMCELCDEK